MKNYSNLNKYMITTNEIEFLLDLPNQFDLEFDSDIRRLKAKEIAFNYAVQKFSNSSLSISSQNNECLPALRIKTRGDPDVDDPTNSEIYLKILKNSKNAVRTVEEEKNNKISLSTNQSLLEKIKIYPVVGSIGGKNLIEDEDYKNFETIKGDQINIKRK
jgi:hypothetical protein